MFLRKTLLLFVSIVCSLALSAQVVVNEFSASNLSQFTDNFGRYEDWIELYNTSAEAIDITGYGISDNVNKPQKWLFPAGSVIEGNGYLIVYCTGRDTLISGSYHSNFKLKQTMYNEEIVLADVAGNVVQEIPLGITQSGHSFAREVDGSDNWMISTSPSFASTNDGAPKVTRYAPRPYFNLEAGSYKDSVVVYLINIIPGYRYTYTTNGLLPKSTDSPIVDPYTTRFKFDETTVLKVRAFPLDQEDEMEGLVGFATYFINESFTLPVFSVAADGVVNLANGQGELRPIGSLEYFSAEGKLQAATYGELNRHGQDSWVNLQRSLDWISRDEMGYTAEIDAPLFTYSDKESYQRIMFRASGDDNFPATNDPNDDAHRGSTHIRDEYVHQLAKQGGMELDVRAVERDVLFLNGIYWGVYAHREKPDDHDYIDHHYKQDKYNIQFLQTWGNTWAEYGGEQAFDDWDTMRDMILKQDMSDTMLYHQVLSKYNETSLIDYVLTNLMAVASDWLNYNTGWWRGIDPEGKHKKWGYILWDLDATFDYYINYSGVPNTDPDAVPCDLEDISDYMDQFFGVDTSFFVWQMDTFWQYPDVGRHEKILLKLLDESPEFKNYYYQRSADHMNTIFSCQNMRYVLDSMLATIEPEMQRHIDRWGGSMQLWQSNVKRLTDFVDARCGLIDDGIVECYDLTGPFEVTILTDPPGAGEVKFNTVKIKEFPWKGDYFGNMKNSLKAEATGDLVFSGWRASSGTSIFDNNLSIETQVEIIEADTIYAVFGNLVAVDDFPIGGDASIYPNPTTGSITITLPELNTNTIEVLDVFNIAGAKVYSSGSQTYDGNGIYIDGQTMFLEPGMYTVAIQADGKIYRGNFVVIK